MEPGAQGDKIPPARGVEEREGGGERRSERGREGEKEGVREVGSEREICISADAWLHSLGSYIRRAAELRDSVALQEVRSLRPGE